jgi:hypothetical protein
MRTKLDHESLPQKGNFGDTPESAKAQDGREHSRQTDLFSHYVIPHVYERRYKLNPANARNLIAHRQVRNNLSRTINALVDARRQHNLDDDTFKKVIEIMLEKYIEGEVSRRVEEVIHSKLIEIYTGATQVTKDE